MSGVSDAGRLGEPSRPGGRMTLLDRLIAASDPLLDMMFEQAALQAVVDPAGRVRRVNAALREVAGRAVDLKGHPHLAELFGIEGREAVRQVLTQASEKAQPTLSSLVRLGRSSVVVGVTPLHEPDAAESGFLVQIREAPPSVQAECQARGSVAHDLNNLMGVVLATIADVADHPGLDEGGREDLRQAAAAAQRACSLVAQLSQRGHDRVVEPQAVEVGLVLRGLTRLLRHAFGAGVRLELIVPEADCTVLIDPVLLDRILLNLCLNAGEAMPSGGVLTLSLASVFVTGIPTPQAALLASDHVVIEIRDTGIGMPAEVLSRVFEPFYTTRRNAGGTGLGLWSVSEGVQLAGGLLTVDSVPGRGTRFVIHLPRHDGDMAMSSRETLTEPLAAAAERKTILLVDDEPTLLRLAERALARAGWRVVTAASGEAALVLLRATPAPDIIVSDLALPGLDGLALLQMAREIHPGLPSILTSGYQADSLDGWLATSGTCFLLKPYRMQALVDAATDMTLDRDAS